MAELQTFVYECYVTVLDNGQQVLFQLFRDPDNGKTLHAQLAFREAGGSWGVPYQCERK
jgi:hypothetical protein